MITELTPEQIAQCPKYVEKWSKIALKTRDHQITVDEVRPYIDQIYRIVNLTPPGEILILPSPEAAIKFLGTKGFDKNQVLSSACYGSQDASWLAFYDFFLNECNVEVCRKIEPFNHLAEICGWWWPFDVMAVVTELPVEIHVNGTQFHNANGPAISYADGFAIYILNGVKVPAWLVTEKNPDPRKIFEIDNVEVRREFVRKVGMERLWYALKPTVIDTETVEIGGKYHSYVLADIQVANPISGRNGGRMWRVLRMENASLPETWHVEGVPSNVRTVREALNVRNSLTESQIDDVNGAEWYQQGDVIIRPKGVKKFKRLPSKLT